jgi:hypothetical protein
MSAPSSYPKEGFVSATRLHRDTVATRLAGNITPLVWLVVGQCETCGYHGPIIEHIITDTRRGMCGPCTARHVWGDKR